MSWKATWNGAADDKSVEAVHLAGLHFERGKATEVRTADTAAMLAGHPEFDLTGPAIRGVDVAGLTPAEAASARNSAEAEEPADRRSPADRLLDAMNTLPEGERGDVLATQGYVKLPETAEDRAHAFRMIYGEMSAEERAAILTELAGDDDTGGSGEAGSTTLRDSGNGGDGSGRGELDGGADGDGGAPKRGRKPRNSGN